MDLGINGKAALVTGASAGIGKAVALELASEGVCVALTARNVERLETTVEEVCATGTDAIGIPADVTDPKTAKTLVTETVKAFGSIDILVNNAGRAQTGGLLETTDKDWEDMTSTKLYAMVRTCREAVPHMQKAGWGRIVNMSSIGGTYPNPKLTISHGLSAAIDNLTKSFALDLAGDGILVNAIAIGAVRTGNWEANMIPKVRDSRPDLATLSDEELIAKLGAEMTPIGRFGTPEEIAAAAAFLASDRNGFITGCVIEASGGADRFM